METHIPGSRCAVSAFLSPFVQMACVCVCVWGGGDSFWGAGTSGDGEGRKANRQGRGAFVWVNWRHRGGTAWPRLPSVRSTKRSGRATTWSEGAILRLAPGVLTFSSVTQGLKRSCLISTCSSVSSPDVGAPISRDCCEKRGSEHTGF